MSLSEKSLTFKPSPRFRVLVELHSSTYTIWKTSAEWLGVADRESDIFLARLREPGMPKHLQQVVSEADEFPFCLHLPHTAERKSP